MTTIPMIELTLLQLQAELEEAEAAWEKALIEVKNTAHPENQIIMDITYLLQDAFNEVKAAEKKIRLHNENTVL